MPSPSFVIPASDSLIDAIETIRPIVHSDPRKARALYAAVGVRYVDDVVEGLVLAYLRESDSASARTRSLVETLARLIKSVAHGLVGQAFGRMTTEHAVAVLEFLDERSSRFGDRPGLGVPIDESAARGIEEASAAAQMGELGQNRQLLVSTMRLVIHRALEYHYKKPFSLLELGFFTRKGVDLGYDAILSGALSTIENAIADADEQQLLDLSAFLERRLLR